MSNYSNNPAQCRVDFFKPSGKWYTTESFEWLGWAKENLIHETFYKSLMKAFPEHYKGMTAVCLIPYHENEHPLMLHEWDSFPLRNRISEPTLNSDSKTKQTSN